MSDTPLSDLITAMISDPGTAGRAPRLAFDEAFLTARLGVKVQGAPAHAEGQYRVAAGDNIQMPIVMTPDGRSMVKACADPAVFAVRYGYEINAAMTGRSLLEMALRAPGIEGVLVCSAASEHSIPIGRDEIPALLAPKPAPAARPWWKLW